MRTWVVETRKQYVGDQLLCQAGEGSRACLQDGGAFWGSGRVLGRSAVSDCSLPGSSVHAFSRREYWSGLS